MPTRDPRSYVNRTPLPIGPQKGLKIQARSGDVYNPSRPTRDDVRKDNFQRRSAQMTGQGFRSVCYKPYHGIGDPFYLDEKKLILHALGQWHESQEWESSSSSEDDDASDDAGTTHKGHMIAAKFVLRRARKGLNTLTKEVVKGRQMIRNVRLGHGLFDLIRQERMLKKNAAYLEKQKRLEAARSTWQPPKRDSETESDSDDDSIPDDDRLFLGDRIREKKKKKAPIPRPYTPQHSSLCDMNSEEDGSQDALFRQLCALNWLLDAMNLEQGYTMSSIMTCWSHNEIGGTRLSGKKSQQERQTEKRWESFLYQATPGKVSKKVSTTRGLGRPYRQSIRLFNPRSSIQSASPAPSSSSSLLNHPPGAGSAGAGAGTGAGGQREETIPEEDKGSVSQTAELEEEHDGVYSKSMFKFLDEYYDSLRKEKNGEEASNNTPGSTSPALKDKEKGPEAEKRAKRSRKKSKSKERDKTPDRATLTPPGKHDLQDALGVPRGMRADKSFKPKPSAELLEFHENKSSNKLLTLSIDLANQFKEVQDDKAMTLHEVLEQLERERLVKCQSKYRAMPTSTSTVHRALFAMRQEGHRLRTKPTETELRRKSSFKGNWFTDIEIGVPWEVKSIWYYQVILYKLRRHGLVESTSKQSVYKFLKVLEGLRDWEICSPDISAAIEFCRQRIVDLSVEEYEEWFKSVFPRITRPVTAPPAARAQRDKKQAAAPTPVSVPASFPSGRPAVRKVQSAFVRRAQR